MFGQVQQAVLDAFAQRFQLAKARLQRVGGLADALDAIKTTLELQLVFADLRLQRRDGAVEPLFGFVPGNVEGVARLGGDGVEEFLRQHPLFQTDEEERTADLALIDFAQAADFALETAQGKAHGRGEFEVVLGGKTLVGGIQHGGDFARVALCLRQRGVQPGKKAFHALAQPPAEDALEHLLAHALAFLVQGGGVQTGEQLGRLRRKHAAHGVILFQPVVEAVFLFDDFAHHVFDDGVVFAAQPFEFAKLGFQVGLFEQQGFMGAVDDFAGGGVQVFGNNLLFGGQHVVRQRALKGFNAAFPDQFGLVLDAPHQRFLRRERENLAGGQPQHAANGLGLLVDFVIDVGVIAQTVPEAVDFVEDDKLAALGIHHAARAHVVAPDGQIALRHARVGGEDEEHGVRTGQQREGQFRLGTDGVQPRRVQNHQPLREQGVVEFDDGVTPARHFHHAVAARLQPFLTVGVDGKAQFAAFFFGYAGGFAHAREGILQGTQVALGNGFDHPVFGVEAQFGNTAQRGGFNRQQADLRHSAQTRGAQFGGAHGGAPGAGGQHAVGKVREENGVDEFGFAARKFGNEGDREPFVMQAGERAIQALFAVFVEQVVVFQPALELLGGLADTIPKLAIYGELINQVQFVFCLHRMNR